MHELDHPFRSALRSIHADLALCDGAVVRYPATHAPFLAVEQEEADVADALRRLIAPGESVCLIGAVPRVPQGWRLERFAPLAQMMCEQPIEQAEDRAFVELTAADRVDVLELTGLVYPHYFRERTMDLGRCFGIRHEGRLAAMIGERLGTPSTRELSAICTHPDFGGRGHARWLTAMLTNDTLARGKRPFLHVSYANTRAKTLYERLGYRLRADVPFAALHRTA